MNDLHDNNDIEESRDMGKSNIWVAVALALLALAVASLPFFYLRGQVL